MRQWFGQIRSPYRTRRLGNLDSLTLVDAGAAVITWLVLCLGRQVHVE